MTPCSLVTVNGRFEGLNLVHRQGLLPAACVKIALLLGVLPDIEVEGDLFLQYLVEFHRITRFYVPEHKPLESLCCDNIYSNCSGV
jgi:hypothetical protein